MTNSQKIWEARRLHFGKTGGNRKGFKQSPEHLRKRVASMKRDWKNRHDEKVKALLLIIKEHDEVLNRRLKSLKRMGAKVFWIDYAEYGRRSKEPDIMYFLNGEIVFEDVKHTGEIQVERKQKI